MKRILSIILSVIWMGTAVSSEMTVTSEEKVGGSQLIAIAKVTSVKMGKIRTFAGAYGERQQLDIDLEIIERILGESPSKIRIRAYSTSYEDEDGAHGSTAGFSGYGIKVGDEYLAYLNILPRSSIFGTRRYELASDSNQYFEQIYRTDGRIDANGQTGDTVVLDTKLKFLEHLAKNKH